MPETRSKHLMKSNSLSPDLAAIVVKTEASQIELIELLWAYLKKNKLECEDDEQFFLPDEKMAKIFGTNRIRGLSMVKHIQAHLTPIDTINDLDDIKNDSGDAAGDTDDLEIIFENPEAVHDSDDFKNIFKKQPKKQEPKQGGDDSNQESKQGDDDSNQEPKQGDDDLNQEPKNGDDDSNQESKQGDDDSNQEPKQGVDDSNQELMQGDDDSNQDPKQGDDDLNDDSNLIKMPNDSDDSDQVVFHSRHLGFNLAARDAKIEQVIFGPLFAGIAAKNASIDEYDVSEVFLNGNESAKHFKTYEEMESDFPLWKRNTDSDNKKVSLKNREPLKGDDLDDSDVITDIRHNEVQNLVLNYFLMQLPQHLIWPLTF